MSHVLGVAIALAAAGIATAALLLLAGLSGVTGPAAILYSLATIAVAASAGVVPGVACGLMSSAGLIAFVVGRGHDVGLESGACAVGLLALGAMTGRLADDLRRRQHALSRKYEDVVRLIERLRGRRSGCETSTQLSKAADARAAGDQSVSRLLAALREISSSLNEQRILEATLRAVHEVAEIPLVTIHMHDRKRDRILPGMAFPHEAGGAPTEQCESAMREVLKTRVPVVRPHDSVAGAALVVMPLFDRAMLTGFLVAESMSDQASAVERISILAASCGLALSSARLSQRFELQSKLDAATGLRAAPAMRDLVQERIMRGPVAVAIIAADGMRRVNEKYGRKAGDKVILSLAKIVTMEVGTDGVTGRYGGASLLVVLPGYREDATTALAERVRRRVNAAVTAGPEGLAGALTVSIGVAAASVGPPDQLLQEAERALSAATAGGGDKVISQSIEAGTGV